MEGVWIKVEELEKLKQQRDELLAAHKTNADLAFDTLGQAPRTYYRGLKLLMDSSLAAIAKVKGEQK